MEQIRFKYSLFFFTQTFQKTNLRICNTTSNVANSLRLAYFTRLSVGLNHMHEPKFCHNFRDSLNPICNCGNAIESTKHYLLYCSNFKNERQSLLQNVRIVNSNLLSMNEDALTHLLL